MEDQASLKKKILFFLGCATVRTNFKSRDTIIIILIDRLTLDQPVRV